MEKIDLFCGINSMGIPFSRENKKHVGYFDIVKENLIKQGYDVNGINISSLNKNHTWDLARIFNYNYSLSKIKNYSIDELRNTNMLFKLIIPKKIKERYMPDSDDDKITFKDVYVNSEKPIFIYSAGPVELMDKNIRKKLAHNLNELVMKCVNNIEKNLFY